MARISIHSESWKAWTIEYVMIWIMFDHEAIIFKSRMSQQEAYRGGTVRNIQASSPLKRVLLWMKLCSTEWILHKDNQASVPCQRQYYTLVAVSSTSIPILVRCMLANVCTKSWQLRWARRFSFTFLWLRVFLTHLTARGDKLPFMMGPNQLKIAGGQIS